MLSYYKIFILFIKLLPWYIIAAALLVLSLLFASRMPLDPAGLSSLVCGPVQ